MGDKLVKILPSTFQAGLTLSRLVDIGTYKAPEWTLHVLLRGAGNVDITAEADGSAHRLYASAEDTAQWQPGKYWYSARLTNGDEVVEVASGEIDVTPDFAGLSEGHDGRSHAERVLENIEAVLEKRSTLDQDRYRINNRELYRTPVAELMKLRDLYRAEVNMAKAARSGNLFGRQVKVRFGRIR